MNNKNYILKIVGLLLLLSSTLISCKNKEIEYHNVTDRIEAESKNFNGTTISSEKYLEDINTIEITVGNHNFLIPDRKSQIKSFACTECHSKPLKQIQTKDIKKAHWNIKLKHANENTMNCISCHNGNDMDNLKSITNKSIDFNKSYELCSQCHNKQFEDWKGGAHGKRIGGWAPPRASMTCVNCHNPHEPHFESRWPAVFNTQKVKERE